MTGASAAITAAIIDQWSKSLAFSVLALGKGMTLTTMVSIVPSLNEGTAFGLARGTGPWLLSVIAILVSTWLLALLVRSRSVVAGAALGAAIGGALANVADRLQFGAVRDFIDVHWGSAHWPTFNMADVFVVTGLLLFILIEHLAERKQRAAGGREFSISGALGSTSRTNRH